MKLISTNINIDTHINNKYPNTQQHYRYLIDKCMTHFIMSFLLGFILVCMSHNAHAKLTISDTLIHTLSTHTSSNTVTDKQYDTDHVINHGITQELAQGTAKDMAYQPEAVQFAKKPSVQSIDAQVNNLENQLSNITSVLAKQNELTDINELLNQLAQLKTLLQQHSQSATTQTTSQQITEAVTLSYQISKAKQEYEAFLNKIETTTHELYLVKQSLTGLQQLLSNPANQLDSQVGDQKLNELITITDTSQATSIANKAKTTQLIAQASQALSQLEDLKTKAMQTIESETDGDTALNMEQIQQKIVHHEIALAQLRAELAKDKNQKSLAELQRLQISIFIKQHELWLYHLDSELLKWVPPLTTSLPVGQSIVVTADKLQRAYDKAMEVSYVIDEKITELQTRQKTLADYTAVIGKQPELSDAYQQRLASLQFLKLQITSLKTRYEQDYSNHSTHHVWTRKKLFQDDVLTVNVLSSFAHIRTSLYKISYQVKISFIQYLQHMANKPWYMLSVFAVMLLGALLFRRLSTCNYIVDLLEKNKEVGLIVLLKKVAWVIKKHWLVTGLCLLMVVSIHVIALPSPSYQIIMMLLGMILSVLLWFAMSRLELASGVVLPRQAWQSNMTLIILISCVLLYGLSRFSAVSQPLVDFYEKLLMLSMAGVAWSSHQYIKRLNSSNSSKVSNNIKNLFKHTNTDGKKHQPHSKTYLGYQIFVNTLPLFIYIISLLGVLGYTHLSWMVLSHALVLLVVFTLFTLGVLFINTARKQLKLASIQRYERGVFFVQEIINPLSLLIKILWLIACLLVGLYLISLWHGDGFFFISEVVESFFQPLFTIKTTEFSLFSVIMMVASPFIVYRIGKWLRTFSFHWLFAKVSDYGIRHSLSIFSQYVAILAGVFVTLNIIGIDLTSFAVFAGALGVGVGLGLQDIAKNFISGILLLIERPLRQGDWIVIDGNEGFVKSIGLRAIVLENFDKQEVIIPNGIAINNSLTNFTHSNQIMRTVLYVGVSYDCEPEKVRRVIAQVLTQNEAVLSNPSWDIVLWEYADSSVNYRLQYHIDLSKNDRLVVQNAILQRIWYVFKEQGINIPYPQRDVYVKNKDWHVD